MQLLFVKNNDKIEEGLQRANSEIIQENLFN